MAALPRDAASDMPVPGRSELSASCKSGITGGDSVRRRVAHSITGVATKGCRRNVPLPSSPSPSGGSPTPRGRPGARYPRADPGARPPRVPLTAAVAASGSRGVARAHDSPLRPGPLRPTRGRAPRCRATRRPTQTSPRSTASTGRNGSRKPTTAAGRRARRLQARPTPRPARRGSRRLGVVRRRDRRPRRSTVRVDSATWSCRAASLLVSESRSASRRVSSDSIATTSPIERRLRQQRPHPGDAGLLARHPGVEVHDLLGGVGDLASSGRSRGRGPRSSSISRSSVSAGTRTTSWAPRVARLTPAATRPAGGRGRGPDLPGGRGRVVGARR